MKIIEGKEVEEILSAKACVKLMKETLINLEEGKAMQPMRLICNMPNTAKFGFMPAYLGDGDYYGAKVLTAYPPNMGTGYPSHIGYVMLFEPEHSQVAGLVDATAVTAIRTGAVSAAATDCLAREDSRVMAILGAGEQARSHARAICTVREIEEIRIYDIRNEASWRFKEEMEQELSVSIVICEEIMDATKEADIICTVTPGGKEGAPILYGSMVKEGVHINAVGTFTPGTREIASDLMAISSLYGDSIEGVKKESGEYIVPEKEGLIDENHIKGTIGMVLSGKIPGRKSEKIGRASCRERV